MRRFLTAPTVWKRPGHWSIPSLKARGMRSRSFPTMPRAHGVRGKPMNFWSVMDDTGANRSGIPLEPIPGVLVCPDAAEVARHAARRFVDWAWQAIAVDGRFNVALSGGSTPREMYRLLATSEFRMQVDWPRV